MIQTLERPKTTRERCIWYKHPTLGTPVYDRGFALEGTDYEEIPRPDGRDRPSYVITWQDAIRRYPRIVACMIGTGYFTTREAGYILRDYIRGCYDPREWWGWGAAGAISWKVGEYFGYRTKADGPRYAGYWKEKAIAARPHVREFIRNLNFHGK